MRVWHCFLFRFLPALFVLALIPLQAEEREPADTLTGPPFVSAAAWGIFDREAGELLWGHEVETVRSIASTTKIMTALVALREIERQPELLEAEVTFSDRAGGTRGSGARIEEGETVSMLDLLYGLMLPSGNDASVAIGESIGRAWAVEKTPVAAAGEGGGETLAHPFDEAAYDAFVARMNEVAQELGMEKTGFRNTHGLDADGHESTVADLAKLTLEAWKHPLFRELVNTRRHTAMVKTADGETREARWTNTNQLLRTEGFYGVKTGTTRRAGACLVSMGSRGDDHLLMVVLGSASSPVRYVDSQNLYRFAWLELGHEPKGEKD